MGLAPGEPEPEEQEGVTFIQRLIVDPPEREPVVVPEVKDDDFATEEAIRLMKPKVLRMPISYPKVGVA